MIYAGIQLRYVQGTLVIIPQKSHMVRHFEDTDMSDSVDLGRQHTVITCTLYARGEEEYFHLLQIAHSTNAADLQIGPIYYKEVTIGERSPIRPLPNGRYECDIEFRAENPIPYKVSTDEKLY